jgi:hypothetical protein
MTPFIAIKFVTEIIFLRDYDVSEVIIALEQTTCEFSELE